MKRLIGALERKWQPQPIWFGDANDAALLDLNSGRVLGVTMHDGYGKWEIWVCLTYWRAFLLTHREPASFWSLAAFPRCWVSMFRAKEAEGAVSEIEGVFGPAINRLGQVTGGD